MKRKTSVIIVAMVLLLALLGLTGCGHRHINGKLGELNFKSKLLSSSDLSSCIISSVEEMNGSISGIKDFYTSEEISLMKSRYNEKFFKSNQVILYKIMHSSSEDNIELCGVVVENGHASIGLHWNSPENLDTDLKYSIFMIHVKSTKVVDFGSHNVYY